MLPSASRGAESRINYRCEAIVGAFPPRRRLDFLDVRERTDQAGTDQAAI